MGDNLADYIVAIWMNEDGYKKESGKHLALPIRERSKGWAVNTFRNQYGPAYFYKGYTQEEYFEKYQVKA